MRATTTNNGKLLGFVQVRVGARTFAVPVEAIDFDRDVGTTPAGGFFAEGDQFGILVDESADVADQIKRATEDAVRHLSLKVLN